MNLALNFSEKLLHYIWQFQKFEIQKLKTTNGEALQIIQVGQLNTNAGPDFIEAKIKIDEIIWVGNIEIHINSSDWHLHKHDENLEYDNIILHLVWENGPEIFRKNGQKIPTLSLKNIVNSQFIADYERLMYNATTIPCESQFEQINGITKMLMLEKVLVDRLERKAKIILTMLEKNAGDWEETTFQLLAKNMGFGLNSIPFEQLANLLPLKIIQKHGDSLFSIEAMLFGIAGFLEEAKDDYSLSLQKEYNFLKNKYKLKQMAKHEWKFMRLRPANFPTVRLSQFAQIIQHTRSLFSYFLIFESTESLFSMFKTKPNDYWQSHYRFKEMTHGSLKGIGNESIELLIINTVVPLLAAYSIDKNEPSYIEKGLKLLESIKAEKNKITRFWNQLGLKQKSAFDSQASIELFNEFCSKKVCLSCSIGATILR
jgi:Protein of unknown function (DUF2851)